MNVHYIVVKWARVVCLIHTLSAPGLHPQPEGRKD